MQNIILKTLESISFRRKALYEQLLKEQQKQDVLKMKEEERRLIEIKIADLENSIFILDEKLGKLEDTIIQKFKESSDV